MKTLLAGLTTPILTVCATIFFLTSGSDLAAQRASGDVGIGAQIGDPTGFTVKVYRPTTSLDLLAAWDLDDFFFLNAHAIFDEHLNDRQTIHFLYGPGAFIGIRDHDGRGNDGPGDDDVEIGLSGTVGIDFMIRRFEIYLHLTPRISVIESTDFELGGGLGFRFYL
jgi:hypothetical protein